MGNNPSEHKGCGDNCPVEQVSWNEIKEFLERLNQKEPECKYRLPTEAEWEYTCRAGTTTVFPFGNDLSKLDEYAWRPDNPRSGTRSIGSRKPNPWGLYDMYGNVYEFVKDYYHDNYEGAPTDGKAWVPLSLLLAAIKRR